MEAELRTMDEIVTNSQNVDGPSERHTLTVGMKVFVTKTNARNNVLLSAKERYIWEITKSHVLFGNSNSSDNIIFHLEDRAGISVNPYRQAHKIRTYLSFHPNTNTAKALSEWTFTEQNEPLHPMAFERRVCYQVMNECEMDIPDFIGEPSFFQSEYPDLWDQYHSIWDQYQNLLIDNSRVTRSQTALSHAALSRDADKN